MVVTKQDPFAALERLRALGSGQWRGLAEEVERSRDEWEERSREIEQIWTECQD